jgi:hypothetical protein
MAAMARSQGTERGVPLSSENEGMAGFEFVA